MAETFQTDEDEMIHRLMVHRDLVTWCIQQLRVNGIEAKRTRGNDPHGDIVLIHADDVPQAKAFIHTLQEHARAERGLH
jgi:hypothetical protein